MKDGGCGDEVVDGMNAVVDVMKMITRRRIVWKVVVDLNMVIDWFWFCQM